MGNACRKHDREDDENRESTEGLIKINLDFMERLHNPSDPNDGDDITESEL